MLFKLKGVPDEYMELDTRALLRSAFKERVEGLASGVIGGIFSSDEARADFDLAITPGGHGAMPRVQQQVVPLSYGSSLQPPPVAAPPPAAPEPAMPAKDTNGRVIQSFRTARANARQLAA